MSSPRRLVFPAALLAGLLTGLGFAPWSWWPCTLIGVAAFVVLLLWQAGDVKLALLTAAGFLGGFALFALAGWLGIRSLWIAVVVAAVAATVNS